MIGKIRGLVSRRAGGERRLFFSLLILAGLAWAFLAIAENVLGSSSNQLDSRLLLSLRVDGDPSDPIGPSWVEEMGRDLSALGSNIVLLLVVVSTASFLLLTRRRRAGIAVLTATLSGIAVSFGLKSWFVRPRPDLVTHSTETFTSSFPSAHSFLSAVVYLTLGALLARVQPRRSIRVLVLAMAALLTVTVGVSRVYLGVHWPSDVLAGWTGGIAWAFACWLVTVQLQRQGVVESEEGETASPEDASPSRPVSSRPTQGGRSEGGMSLGDAH